MHVIVADIVHHILLCIYSKRMSGFPLGYNFICLKSVKCWVLWYKSWCLWRQPKWNKRKEKTSNCCHFYSRADNGRGWKSKLWITPHNSSMACSSSIPLPIEGPTCFTGLTKGSLHSPKNSMDPTALDKNKTMMEESREERNYCKRKGMVCWIVFLPKICSRISP